MLRWGIASEELQWLVDHPSPPDVVGINHYASSDRYLDHALDQHGPREICLTDDGREFVDVEAVRACMDCSIAVCGIVEEVWERYGLPVAITEAHLGSTREEQLRWLKEFWDGATSLKMRGVDVRAVTVWALLGSFDWNVLVTKPGSFYEPGPFDVRGRAPRATALATLMRELASGRTSAEHPLLALPGWWRRPDRIYRPNMQGRSAAPAPAGPGVDMEDRATRPLVILGATGTLGHAFARACEVRGIPYHVMTRREVDLANPRSVDRAMIEHRPWAVVNAAGYVRVDEAEREPDSCMQANAVGSGVLAAACSRYGVDLVCFSSDLVFDGSHERLQRPYVESDPVAPLSAYGRSKAEMEQRVLDVMPNALVVRTAAFFGPWDRSNFVSQTIAALVDGQRVRPAIDAVVSPTYVVDLVNTVLDLLIDREHGIWHLTNRGAVSWKEFAEQIATVTRLPPQLIEGVPTRTLGYAAARPRYAVLASERGAIMPTLDDALARYLRDVVLEAPRVREERRRAVIGARRSAAA